MASARSSESIFVKSLLHDYRIDFESFTHGFGETVILIDSKVNNLYFNYEANNAIIIDATEENKNIGSVVKVVDTLILAGVNRSEWITVIGGGVIQDIATMATSIYKRGLMWRFIPTTLQAMIDSCVGGKSSINHGGAKNVLGNFYPPYEILIDVKFLSTLDQNDLICGLIEGAKICAASGPEELDDFLTIAKQLSIPYDSKQAQGWESLIHLALHQKKSFVELDEFDVGIRKLLNFGHTFGHAIEASTDFEVPHGIAVGVGILVSNEFASDYQNFLRDDLIPFLEKILEPVISIYMPSLNKIEWESFFEALAQDKKSERNYYNFIVPTSNGLKLIREDISEATKNRVTTAFKGAIDRLATS